MAQRNIATGFNVLRQESVDSRFVFAGRPWDNPNIVVRDGGGAVLVNIAYEGLLSVDSTDHTVWLLTDINNVGIERGWTRQNQGGTAVPSISELLDQLGRETIRTVVPRTTTGLSILGIIYDETNRASNDRFDLVFQSGADIPEAARTAFPAGRTFYLTSNTDVPTINSDGDVVGADAVVEVLSTPDDRLPIPTISMRIVSGLSVISAAADSAGNIPLTNPLVSPMFQLGTAQASPIEQLVVNGDGSYSFINIGFDDINLVNPNLNIGNDDPQVNNNFGGLRTTTRGGRRELEVDTDQLPLEGFGNIAGVFGDTQVQARAAGSVLTWRNTAGQNGVSAGDVEKWGGAWVIEPNVMDGGDSHVRIDLTNTTNRPVVIPEGAVVYFNEGRVYINSTGGDRTLMIGGGGVISVDNYDPSTDPNPATDFEILSESRNWFRLNNGTEFFIIPAAGTGTFQVVGNGIIILRDGTQYLNITDADIPVVYNNGAVTRVGASGTVFAPADWHMFTGGGIVRSVNISSTATSQSFDADTGALTLIQTPASGEPDAESVRIVTRQEPTDIAGAFMAPDVTDAATVTFTSPNALDPQIVVGSGIVINQGTAVEDAAGRITEVDGMTFTVFFTNTHTFTAAAVGISVLPTIAPGQVLRVEGTGVGATNTDRYFLFVETDPNAILNVNISDSALTNREEWQEINERGGVSQSELDTELNDLRTSATVLTFPNGETFESPDVSSFVNIQQVDNEISDFDRYQHVNHMESVQILGTSTTRQVNIHEIRPIVSGIDQVNRIELNTTTGEINTLMTDAQYGELITAFDLTTDPANLVPQTGLDLTARVQVQTDLAVDDRISVPGNWAPSYNRNASRQTFTEDSVGRVTVPAELVNGAQVTISQTAPAIGQDPPVTTTLRGRVNGVANHATGNGIDLTVDFEEAVNFLSPFENDRDDVGVTITIVALAVNEGTFTINSIEENRLRTTGVVPVVAQSLQISRTDRAGVSPDFGPYRSIPSSHRLLHTVDPSGPGGGSIDPAGYDFNRVLLHYRNSAGTGTNTSQLFAMPERVSNRAYRQTLRIRRNFNVEGINGLRYTFFRGEQDRGQELLLSNQFAELFTLLANPTSAPNVNQNVLDNLVGIEFRYDQHFDDANRASIRIAATHVGYDNVNDAPNNDIFNVGFTRGRFDSVVSTTPRTWITTGQTDPGADAYFNSLLTGTLGGTITAPAVTNQTVVTFTTTDTTGISTGLDVQVRQGDVNASGTITAFINNTFSVTFTSARSFTAGAVTVTTFPNGFFPSATRTTNGLESNQNLIYRVIPGATGFFEHYVRSTGIIGQDRLRFTEVGFENGLVNEIDNHPLAVTTRNITINTATTNNPAGANLDNGRLSITFPTTGTGGLTAVPFGNASGQVAEFAQGNNTTVQIPSNLLGNAFVTRSSNNGALTLSPLVRINNTTDATSVTNGIMDITALPNNTPLVNLPQAAVDNMYVSGVDAAGAFTRAALPDTASVPGYGGRWEQSSTANRYRAGETVFTLEYDDDANRFDTRHWTALVDTNAYPNQLAIGLNPGFVNTFDRNQVYVPGVSVVVGARLAGTQRRLYILGGTAPTVVGTTPDPGATNSPWILVASTDSDAPSIASGQWEEDLINTSEIEGVNRSNTNNRYLKNNGDFDQVQYSEIGSTPTIPTAFNQANNRTGFLQADDFSLNATRDVLTIPGTGTTPITVDVGGLARVDITATARNLSPGELGTDTDGNIYINPTNAVIQGVSTAALTTPIAGLEINRAAAGTSVSLGRTATDALAGNTPVIHRFPSNTISGTTFTVPGNAVILQGDYIVDQVERLYIITSLATGRVATVEEVSPTRIGTTADTALAGNTPLLQIGTTATTALAGNTDLLQLGTTATTALAGNTVTIQPSPAQAGLYVSGVDATGALTREVIPTGGGGGGVNLGRTRTTALAGDAPRFWPSTFRSSSPNPTTPIARTLISDGRGSEVLVGDYVSDIEGQIWVVTAQTATQLTLDTVGIHDLDDTAVTNQYISEIDVTNGVVSVTRVALPTSIISQNDLNGLDVPPTWFTQTTNQLVRGSAAVAGEYISGVDANGNFTRETLPAGGGTGPLTTTQDYTISGRPNVVTGTLGANEISVITMRNDFDPGTAGTQNFTVNYGSATGSASNIQDYNGVQLSVDGGWSETVSFQFPITPFARNNNEVVVFQRLFAAADGMTSTVGANSLMIINNAANNTVQLVTNLTNNTGVNNRIELNLVRTSGTVDPATVTVAQPTGAIPATFTYDPDTANTVYTNQATGTFVPGQSINDHLSNIGIAIAALDDDITFDGVVEVGTPINGNPTSQITIDLGTRTDINSEFTIVANSGSNIDETVVNSDPSAATGTGTASTVSVTDYAGRFISSFTTSVATAGAENRADILNSIIGIVNGNTETPVDFTGSILSPNVLRLTGAGAETRPWTFAINNNGQTTDAGTLAFSAPTTATTGGGGGTTAVTFGTAAGEVAPFAEGNNTTMQIPRSILNNAVPTQADINNLRVDAATVNTFTVGANVPGGAVFTDTQLDNTNILSVLNSVGAGTISSNILPDATLSDVQIYASTALRNADTRSWNRGALVIIAPAAGAITSFIFTGNDNTTGPTVDTQWQAISSPAAALDTATIQQAITAAYINGLVGVIAGGVNGLTIDNFADPDVTMVRPQFLNDSLRLEGNNTGRVEVQDLVRPTNVDDAARADDTWAWKVASTGQFVNSTVATLIGGVGNVTIIEYNGVLGTSTHTTWFEYIGVRLNNGVTGNAFRAMNGASVYSTNGTNPFDANAVTIPAF